MDADLLTYYAQVQTYDWTDVADRWHGPETILHRWRAAIVRRAIARFDNGTPWLDVGCGTGLVTRHLRPGSIGIDVNPRNIAALKRHAPHIVGRVAEAEHLPFPDHAFSRVLCTEVLEHFRDPSALMREIHRIMAPNGILIVTTPNTAFLWKFRGLSHSCTGTQREPFHREFTRRELTEIFASHDFRLASCRTCCAHMQWLIVAHP